MRGHLANVPNWVHTPEDAALVCAEDGVAAVFDGLAGHGDGAVASAFAREVVRNHIDAGPLSDAPNWPAAALDVARSKLRDLRTDDEDISSHATTTAVVARVTDGELFVAWCGDSRAYELCGDGRLVRLTTDHDFLREQVAKSFIGPARADQLRMVLEEVQTQSDAWRMGGGLAKKAFRRSNTMTSELCVGPIDYLVRPWNARSVLVLTTDGVHDNLPRSVMQTVAARYVGDAVGLCEALVAAAHERALAGEGRAHPDDITAAALGD